MTIQTDQMAVVPGNAAADSEFDLDISIVESGLVVADLLRSTDDGCGSTCESACPASGC